MKVKIASGWSNPGGSTIAHILLCNLFNDNGIDCTFYGPHPWHLKKCKADLLQNIQVQKQDILISHFLPFHKFKCKKHILSCHETNFYDLKTIENKWDSIHFVSNFQKNWQGSPSNSFVIPNVLPLLKKSPLNTKCAGVVGSIDSHKQTHLSVKRALSDGFEKVYIFGHNGDPVYFLNEIKPMIGDKVIHINNMEDQQKMYDMVDAVYHSSKRETFNYVKAECNLTGVDYRGLDSADSNAEYWDNDRILKEWKHYFTKIN